MPSYALTDFTTRIRDRGWDIDSVPYPDALLVDMANQFLGELWANTAALSPERLPIAEQSVSVEAGTKTYTLAADMMQALRVDWLDGDTYRQMEQASWNDKEFLDATCNTANDARYFIQADQLVFEQMPGWTATVRIQYVTYPTELTVSPANTIFLTRIQRDWAIYSILADILAQDESPQYAAVAKRLDALTGQLGLQNAHLPKVTYAQGGISNVRPRRWSDIPGMG